MLHSHPHARYRPSAKPGKASGIRLDGLTLFALLFCVLLYGPFTGVLFGVEGRYVPEVPVVICGIALYFISDGPQRVRFRVALVKAAPILYLVLLFAVIGLMRGTPFADVYSDFRAIAALILSYALIAAVGDDTALRFILTASVISLILYATSIAIGLGEVIFTKSTFDVGKITIPIFSFSFAAMYLAGKSRLLFAVCIICLTIVVSVSSLRYMFALLGFIYLIGVKFSFFGFRKEVSRLASFLSMAVVGGVAVIVYVNLDLIGLLNWAQGVARQIGFGEQAIHQVLVKTSQNITFGLNYGDRMYMSFFDGIFDFGRFALPRGIGHESSIGDPAIYGGNTIDSSLMYLNYHFSILGTIVFLAIVSVFAAKLFVQQRFGAKFVIVLFAIPILFVFYLRAIAFVSVSEAISLALAVRGIQLLAQELRNSPRRADAGLNG